MIPFISDSAAFPDICDIWATSEVSMKVLLGVTPIRPLEVDARRPRAVISAVLKLTSIGGVQNMYTFAISLI